MESNGMLEWPEAGDDAEERELPLPAITHGAGMVRGGPKTRLAYNTLLRPPLPAACVSLDISHWPQHATDAYNFLMYQPVDANDASTTKIARNWGKEWEECVNVFLRFMEGAGFPVSMPRSLLQAT
jgi:hypothetical protein